MDNPLNNAQVTNKKIDYSNPANFELQNINLSLIEKAFKKNRSVILTHKLYSYKVEFKLFLNY